MVKNFMLKQRTRFIQLKNIFATLHGPKGCLWDKKQTHRSLLPYLKEETEEFIAAVKSNNFRHMQEELGDILLQVMFHSQIASKENKFDIEEVVAALIKKLKRRRPHVFGKVKVKSTQQIIANWHKIKAREKGRAQK